MKIKKKGALLLAAGLAAAVGVGGFFLSRSGGDPVAVYPFLEIGMTEYWGDSQESYGPVSADNIQTVFLSGTQTVTEVAVKEGDEVKKGDLLLRFDTTLSEIQLERKRLAMEKEKFQLTQEEERLKELRRTEPYVEPYIPPTEPTEPVYGTVLTTDYAFDGDSTHTGLTEDTAIQIWLQNDTHIHSGILQEAYALGLQRQNAVTPAPEPPVETLPSNPSAAPSLRPIGKPSADSTEPMEETTGETIATLPTETPTEPVVTEPSSPTEPTAPTVPETKPATALHVIIRTSEKDEVKNTVQTWVGMKLYPQGEGKNLSFTFRYFTASHTLESDWHYQEELRKDPPPETTEPIAPDYGSGYSDVELNKMIKEQMQVVADQEFKVKLAEAEYKLMAAELSDGNIYANTDGVVVSLISEEEAQMNRQPMLKISGGGGYIIKGSISELEKDTVSIGQEVTVNDWNTGGTYTGVIQEIGDYPSSDRGWNGMGNPNATYYPFSVFVDGEADLQTGMYASVTYASAQSTNGIYLYNPFLRTEGGETYVYVRGGSGKLEKRTVTTGKSLWGSYTEVLSGVTEEDYLAFPYGKEAKHGAPTAEGDLSDLYNY